MAGKCPHCGHDLAPGAKRCYNCGADFDYSDLDNMGCRENLIIWGVILAFAILIFVIL